MTTKRIEDGRKLLPTMDELLHQIDDALEDSYGNENEASSSGLSIGIQTKEDQDF